MLVERLGRGLPTERFAGPRVQRVSDRLDLLSAPTREISSLREVLAQQWTGPEMLDTVIKHYALAVVWARYSSGLR